MSRYHNYYIFFVIYNIIGWVIVHTYLFYYMMSYNMRSLWLVLYSICKDITTKKYHLTTTNSNILCISCVPLYLHGFVLRLICFRFLNVRNYSWHLIVVTIIHDFDKTCILSCCIITRELLPWQQSIYPHWIV